MTIGYFDCFAGSSGEMTLGALIDAGGDRAVLDAAVEALRLGDDVKMGGGHETRGHAGGTRILVGVAERVERTVPALRRVIEDSEAPDAVKSPALDAIDRLARAEAQVHNAPMGQAHLHELSGADTLVDVVGAFWLLHALDVGRVYASPLPAPRGLKNDMPLPAPASLRVLEGTGAVFQPTDETRELVTPTGAAILAATATFERPAMSLRRIGYGIGAHNAPGNALAVWIGDEVAAETGVILVETNLDDMAPNLIAALTEDLMAAGPVDRAVLAAVLEKGRPGHLLTGQVASEAVARLSDQLLRHSTTLGLRLTPVQRVIAGRMVIEVTTPIGSARVKVKELDGKPVDVAPEYEDCRRISRERGIDLREVMRVVAESARRQVGLE